MIVITLLIIIVLFVYVYRSAQIPRILNKVFMQEDGTLSGSHLPIHDEWEEMNTGYKVNYWSMKDCREYLQKHFSPTHLETFDCIQAYAGKTNFFRYCVVYREGGWYSDWKQKCLVPSLLDTLSSGGRRWVSCWDRGNSDSIKMKCMQNALFGAVPGSPILKKAIDICIDHTKRKFYGTTPLQTTGVCVLGEAFGKTKYWVMNKNIGVFKDMMFSFNGKPVVKHKYDTNKTDSQDWSKGNNYSKLWENRKYYC
tara:strand:- start:11259 stop:12017 length:759 start_codon:yes stop_codon:yes gene_type:complete